MSSLAAGAGWCSISPPSTGHTPSSKGFRGCWCWCWCCVCLCVCVFVHVCVRVWWWCEQRGKIEGNMKRCHHTMSIEDTTLQHTHTQTHAREHARNPSYPQYIYIDINIPLNIFPHLQSPSAWHAGQAIVTNALAATMPVCAPRLL